MEFFEHEIDAIDEAYEENTVIENIKITMALENQFLDAADEALLRKCYRHEITPDDAIDMIKSDIISRKV